MKNGYVKLYRSILGKPYSNKPDYVWVWCYLLLRATYKEREVMIGSQKILLKPGQLITGRKKLAEQTGVNKIKIYRILKCYENEHQIEQRKTNKFTIITIKNWGKFQADEHQIKQQMNNKRTTDEQQMNTNNKDKNIKKEKNKEKIYKKEKYLDFVFLTQKEYDKLIIKLDKAKTEDMIEKLNNYIGQIGIKKANQKYTSHYHTILNWIRREKENNGRAKTEGQDWDKIKEKRDDYKWKPKSPKVQKEVDKILKGKIIRKTKEDK